MDTNTTKGMNSDTKKMLIVVAVIVALIGAYFLVTYKAQAPLATPQENPQNTQTATETVYTSKVFTFASATDKFTIQYDATADKAKLSLDDKVYELNRAMSGSGARYLSTDGTVEYWEHQNKASVKIGDKTIFDEAANVTATADETTGTGL